MDPKRRQAIMALLKIFNGNRSKVAEILHISRNTVADVCKQMNEKNEGKPSGKDEEKTKRVSDEEYRSILKKVGLLSYRVVNLEGKYDKQIRLHNVLAKFIDNSVTPRLNIIGDEFKNIAENITKNTRNIGYLQRDVNIFKEIKKVEFREIMAKSEARQRDRDIAHEEAGQRAVETMREERRKKEQGSFDAAFQKLEELKDMDKRKMIT